MSALRLADQPTAPAGEAIDDAPLDGRWRNADAHAAAPAIRTAELARAADGSARLRMLGLDGFDWGEAAIDRVYAGSPSASTAVGFTASFAVGGRRARIQANIKLGVMVLAGFVRDDHGAVPPRFIRDFMYGDGDGDGGGDGGGDGDGDGDGDGASEASGAARTREEPGPGPAPLLGRWRNTLAPAANRGIAAVTIAEADDRRDNAIVVTLEIVGPDGPATWGPVGCEVHACDEEDRVASSAALGVVQLDAMAVELQLRVNKGILCVMSWTRFRGSERHAWVTRELFAKEGEG